MPVDWMTGIGMIDLQQWLFLSSRGRRRAAQRLPHGVQPLNASSLFFCPLIRLYLFLFFFPHESITTLYFSPHLFLPKCTSLFLFFPPYLIILFLMFFPRIVFFNSPPPFILLSYPFTLSFLFSLSGTLFPFLFPNSNLLHSHGPNQNQKEKTIFQIIKKKENF